MIRGLSGTAIAEDKAGMGSEDEGERQGEVKDLEHGVKQGGKVRENWRCFWLDPSFFRISSLHRTWVVWRAESVFVYVWVFPRGKGLQSGTLIPRHVSHLLASVGDMLVRRHGIASNRLLCG